ncbi:hypothetical protein Q3G72_002937 [Acer saccharum]|nr:hypothetical protein Q3G72_002937 [Acer saccharum]
MVIRAEGYNDLNPHAASTTTIYDMVVNGRPLKRMKRRVTADLGCFDFLPLKDLVQWSRNPDLGCFDLQRGIREGGRACVWDSRTFWCGLETWSMYIVSVDVDLLDNFSKD